VNGAARHGERRFFDDFGECRVGMRTTSPMAWKPATPVRK
jgi:hypothetical protein